MTVLVLICGFGLALLVLWHVLGFISAQLRRAAGYQTPPRRRRQVPVSASYLPQ